jgi:hypothetical protein
MASLRGGSEAANKPKESHMRKNTCVSHEKGAHKPLGHYTRTKLPLQPVEFVFHRLGVNLDARPRGGGE